ncbi:MAG: DUF4112 domain-containing protein [Salinisphaeraceae bacterium]|nr:DUF4112 domain-containing protein [Salinisphaeraceae bacterium]
MNQKSNACSRSPTSNGNAQHAAIRARLQKLARLMDDAFTLPGGVRIGLDGLIGMIPVVGDIVGALLALYIVWQARRLGVPGRLQRRMLGNIGLELLVGLVPVAGDLFDFAFKANRRNLHMIEAHLAWEESGHPPGSYWYKNRVLMLLVLLLTFVLVLAFL